ncbi:MAG: FGGY-family carbohydrate kinase [Thermoprotei archaeon]|nr:FGGY-family carbohydrate kinase [Thermoprotei archaeon]
MGKEGYVLAVDIGTSMLKAGLVDVSDFTVKVKVSERASFNAPRHGWAEVDPEGLWAEVSRLVSEVAGPYYGLIRGLTVSGHMAGVVPIDKSGSPLRNLIIWLDERAAGYPRELWSGFPKFKGYNFARLVEFLLITGGAPSRTGKDPLSKMDWIRHNEPEVWRRTFKILGTNGFIIFKLTGNHVISPDEACLTWLLDRGDRWSLRLLRRYNMPLEFLPRISKSTDIAGYVLGEVSRDLNVPPNTPVIVGSGDLTSAAVGSGAVGEGELHVYIGTSSWVAGHISRRKVDLLHYIGSIPSAIPGMYLLVAEQEIAGGALDHIMKLLGVEGNYGLVEELASKAAPGSRGLIFAPWLYGERAPIDDPEVRGALIGLSLDHGRSDVLRAVMEGVALNIKWSHTYMEKIVGPRNSVNIVGGGAKSELWCQIIANTLNKLVYRIREPENSTLRGSAMIASVALGIVPDFKSAASRLAVDKEFKPDKEQAQTYHSLFKEYIKIYGRLKETFYKLGELRRVTAG